MRILAKLIIWGSLVAGTLLALITGISAMDTSWGTTVGMACLVIIVASLTGALIYHWLAYVDHEYHK